MILQSKYTTEEQIQEMRKEILLEKQSISQGKSKKVFKDKKSALKLGGRMILIAIILLLATNLVFVQIAKSKGELPSILGFHLFVVESGSMEPTFHIGSVLLCREPKNSRNLKVNDVVTFWNLSGHIVTHRIIEIIPDESGKISYRTKGDNPRNSPDQDPLTTDRVVAVFILKIPFT